MSMLYDTNCIEDIIRIKLDYIYIYRNGGHNMSKIGKNLVVPENNVLCSVVLCTMLAVSVYASHLFRLPMV